MTKTCGRCRLDKPLANFGVRNSNRDGIHEWCRECVSVARKISYAKHRKSISARLLNERKLNARYRDRDTTEPDPENIMAVDFEDLDVDMTEDFQTEEESY